MQTPADPPSSQEPLVLQPLPPEDWPSFDHIITEDDAPVDSVFSEKQMRLLTEPLYASWKPDRPFVAFANVGRFYRLHIPPLVPDVLLSVNVRLPENLFPKLNRSYFVWAYGKPPEVVIEVVSNCKGGEDTEKLEKYASVRVSNYFIFDPEHHLNENSLRGYRLNGSRYEPIQGDSFVVQEVGLALAIWHGRYEETDSQWLRWVDLQGKLIATGAERADFEAERADANAEENQRLTNLLRRHGIDPMD